MSGDEQITKMLLPDSAYTHLEELRICRLLNGLWQVGGGHGRIDSAAAIAEMLAYHDAGFVTWDLADHYGPAEDFVGKFRQQLAARGGESALRTSHAFTKWVPQPTARITRAVVEEAINISLRRMQVQTIDLLQFHWWDYDNPAYLDALKYLTDLREAGKIRHLALTNFDTEHLRIITEHGIRIVSNQVQFSLVDQRPLAKMVDYCQQHNIQLLTYGTYCGGLLSERFVGQPEPAGSLLNTASLRKYKNMIDAWGGWVLFQQLLSVLKQVAEKHSVSIANVAVRMILDQPAVAGVIAGVRLGLSEHRNDNARIFALELDHEDRTVIQQVTAHGRDLLRGIGDCGDEYRRR